MKFKGMNTLYMLVFVLMFCNVSAQSLYQDRANTQVSYPNEESFIATIENSAYGTSFNQSDRNLNDELKAMIQKFVKETNEPKFRQIGKIELQIIKRNQTYYIVAQKSPERLLELKSFH